MNEEDLINYDYKGSNKHIKMPKEKRAAIFNPFSSLVGFKETTIETKREVSKKHELTEDEMELLDSKIEFLNKSENKDIDVTITYFVKDLKKDGGSYQSICSKINRIDFELKIIKLKNKKNINFNDIISIDY